MKSEEINTQLRFCHSYDDEFPFRINGLDLEGKAYLTECDVCKEKVIAYYQFTVTAPICPECFWRMAKEIKKAWDKGNKLIDLDSLYNKKESWKK